MASLYGGRLQDIPSMSFQCNNSCASKGTIVKGMILLQETGNIFTILNAVSMTKLLPPVVATANLIITQQVVILNKCSQCITRPRVVETAIREEK
jgi:hypothetical protein